MTHPRPLRPLPPPPAPSAGGPIGAPTARTLARDLFGRELEPEPQPAQPNPTATDGNARKEAATESLARRAGALSDELDFPEFVADEQVFGLARTFRLEVPGTTPILPLVDSLNQIDAVESALPNLLTHQFDGTGTPGTVAADTWRPWQQVCAQEALAYEPGDPAVILGIVDSGVAERHPELAGRLRPGFDTVQIGQSDLAQGLELLGDSAVPDARPIDRHVGHGMGCAGILGALGPYAGVVAYALARGCVLVAASGNNGGETRYWPAAYPGVIAVD